MRQPSAVAGLVLAAGGGRRLGRAKALVEVGGELLVDRAVRLAHEAGCAPVVTVLGADAAAVVGSARLDDTVVVVNDGWRAGMGSSLQCGLAALRDLGAAAAVVLLVDQPRVTAALVERVVATWRGATTSAVVPSYGGQPRNPVLLDASAWDAVAALAVGDVGARAWLRAHPEDVTIVACDDLGDAVDIDTDADLTQLLEDMR